MATIIEFVINEFINCHQLIATLNPSWNQMDACYKKGRRNNKQLNSYWIHGSITRVLFYKNQFTSFISKSSIFFLFEPHFSQHHTFF
jgi:hypothetical protein